MDKQRIRIGLLDLSPAWAAIMDYLGCDYALANLQQDLNEQFSLIISNRPADPESSKILMQYVRRGGSLIECMGSEIYYKDKVQKNSKRQVYDRSGLDYLRQIPFLDLYSEVHLHRDHEYFDGFIHITTKGKGAIGFFGGDPVQLVHSLNFKRKRFMSHRTPFPDEIVSKVSKGYVLQLLLLLCKQLHYLRDLPFIYKHISPDSQPLFAFRIDSDYGNRDSVNKLLRLSRNTGIPFTWFLHVEAHEDWLDVFKVYPEQETALHCYKHATSDNASKLSSDIEKAAQILKKKHIPFKGYAAPYGISNTALRSSLSAIEPEYSSEFTLLYDALPLCIPQEDHWQVPVHPICTGSLSRLSYSNDDIRTYFESKTELHKLSHEPLIFYHHPMQKGIDMWKNLFTDLISGSFQAVTFSELLNWFKKRQRTSFEAYAEPGSVQVICEDENDLCLNFSMNMDFFDLLSFRSQTMPQHSKGSYPVVSDPRPANIDVKKPRKTDISLIKTGIFDSRNRKYL